MCKQGEVIGGDVRVRAASDIVLVEPMGVQWAEDTQHVQQRLRVEDVIDHALQRTEKKTVKSEVGVRKYFRTKISKQHRT